MTRLCGSLVVTAFALVGCGDDNNVANTLVLVAAEPNGDNCESGGVAIHTGKDTNFSGDLDTDEITATQYVCTSARNLACKHPATSLGGTVNR